MSSKNDLPASDHYGSLFDVDQYKGLKEKAESPIANHIWTRQKAQLVARYLYQFLSVTKNGIYIDAFAGPQKPETKEETWSAKQVLEKESIFLRRVCLFENDSSKFSYLADLKKRFCQGARLLSRRLVSVYEGDCNEKIPEYLRMHRIKPKRAAFALLDQRTHECKWDLVRCLASHKTAGTKIELFYFLAQGWMDRSVKSSKTPEKIKEIDAWWGSPEWQAFMEMNSYQRAQCMRKRFTEELGYHYCRAFPMRERGSEGKILFWLLHASDHPRAIPIMTGAYRSLGMNISDEEWEEVNLLDIEKLGEKEIRVSKDDVNY